MHTSPFCTFHCNYFVSFCKEEVPAGTIWREKQTFLRRHLHFAPGCGKIIGRYYAAHNRKRYALVAQSVEHLTFNQRAWDSSSHERTKEKRWIVRFDAFSFYVPAQRRGVHGRCTVSARSGFSQEDFISCGIPLQFVPEFVSGHESQAKLCLHRRIGIVQQVQQCRH